MGRCNEELFKLVSQDKIDENDEFELRLRRKLPDCKRISAIRPVATSGEVTPNQYARPDNQFECMRKGCVNTGTLMMGAANDTATYRAAYDATEFAGGVVTFYVMPGEDATYPITVTFKIGNEEGLTNANVYTQTITEDMVAEDGFAPVAIILADAPDSTVGDGWTPSETGAYLQLSADKEVGFSSIGILDYLEDFELNEIIKMACVTSAGDDLTFNMIEEACTESKLDPKINSLTFSMAATRVSNNYSHANPMYGKGNKTTGFVPHIDKRVVEAYEKDGKEYGRIVLPDADQDECGRIALQPVDKCAVDMLSELSIPRLIDVDEGHFIVIKNEDGTTDIIVNKAFVGKEIRVSYPAQTEAIERVYSTDFFGDVDASLVRIKKLGHKEIVQVFDNILVTTFPMNITSDTAVFNWSFAILRDENGYFYREYEITGR